MNRVAAGFARQMVTPDEGSREPWAERLGKISAALLLGEMVDDPAPVIEAVGDDAMLRHILFEIVDCLEFERIGLAPGYRSALENLLATPFNEADCDRAVSDLTARVEQGLHRRDGSFETLSDIAWSDLPRAACHIVAARILAGAKVAEDATPERALLLSMVLCRWLPRQAPSTDKFQAAQLLGGLAQAFRAFDIAAQAWQMAAMSALEGGRPTGFAGAMTNLGTLLRRMGRPQDARQAYEAAIDAVEDLHEQPVVLAMTLINAATAYSDLGQADRARAACERAISIIPETSEHAGSLIIAYTNLGAALLAQGDEAGSERATLEALTLARRHSIKTQEAVALGHLGQLKQRQGRYDDAIESYKTAVRITEAEHDRWNTQNFLRDLGNCYASLGLDQGACQHYERALELARALGDQRSQGLCLLGLGIARGAKDVDTAREELSAAWETFNSANNEHLAQRAAAALAQLALLEATRVKERGDAQFEHLALAGFVGPTALKDATALAKAREWLQAADRLSDLSDRRNELHLAHIRAQILLLEGDIDPAIALMKREAEAERDPTDSVRAASRLANTLYHLIGDASAALHWYKRALDRHEDIVARVAGSGVRSELRVVFGLIASEAVFCALDLNDLGAAFDFCERARSAELRRLHNLRGRAAPILSLVEVRRRLAPGTVLVELLPTMRGTVAILVPSEDGPEARSIVARDCGIAELGRAWVAEREAYDRAASPLAAFDDSLGRAWREIVAEFCAGLGRRLMDPIAAALSDCNASTVIIVPHSIPLCFPLHAVLLDGGRWIDSFDIAFLAAASALASAADGATAPGPGEATFFGIADSLEDLRLATIAGHFGDRAALVAGPTATRAAVARRMGTADFIHVACHARQSLLSSAEAAIYLHSDKGEGAEMLDLDSLNRDFVLRPGTKVVLSACESGSVLPNLSSEVVSLAGGIMAAGAQAVVSSFWKVGDAPACLLFERYYENLVGRGMGAASALKEAQLALREMDEASVHERLSAILQESGHEVDPSYAEILSAFSARRTDVNPFDSLADWAAFFLMGVS
jgi:tetratricopeptide (TPR) repeat protein